MSHDRPDSKTEPARRTYASREACRGFQQEGETRIAEISIAPMGTRTYWRHVGGGRWDAKDALYEGWICEGTLEGQVERVWPAHRVDA